MEGEQQLGGGYGSGGGSYGEPGLGRAGGRGRHNVHQQRSSAASAAGKVQGWSSLTRLHRNSASPPRDPFPPLAASSSFSSKGSKNDSKNTRQVQPSPIVLGENFSRLPQNHSPGVYSSSGSSFSSNLQGPNLGGLSASNGAAVSSNGGIRNGKGERGGGRGIGVVGETDERRRRGVDGSDSVSSSSDSFASNSGHVEPVTASTAGGENWNVQFGRSPPVSSAASYNKQGREHGLGPLPSEFRDSSQASARELGASKHERTVGLSVDAEPFFPAVKRGSHDQAVRELAEEGELSTFRNQYGSLDHSDLHQGGINDNRETAAGAAASSEPREPERPSVSDCRSSTGDAERDSNGEIGVRACDHGRDGGDSTAASSFFFVPMEPEWEEDDLYLRYRSDAVRTARERDRFSRGASSAYMRGDHRRAKTMSKLALEKRLLAEKLNAGAANEILNQRNKDCRRDVWHIDLHGLHTGEAVAALESRLMYIESEMNSASQADVRGGLSLVPGNAPEVGETSNLRAHQDALKQRHTESLIAAPRELLVVTGVGVHSQGGPTLPFAVKNFLLTEGYQFIQNTPGSFSVRPKLRLPDSASNLSVFGWLGFVAGIMNQKEA
ncbi:hypothetical protein R1sor_010620 [Riccia sorocarpa]|uniref:Smr domain-containing protein n=1 Tax=Riccia sorocarpa TaxID=122646 RepID=A0ABD3I4N5_9MARC